MTYTRAQLVTATQEAIDGVGADRRWGGTFIQQTLDAVFSRGWRKLLNANNAYRWGKRSVTTDANGQITLASLNSGSADTLERTYKVLAVAQDTIRFTPGAFMDDPLATTVYPTMQGYRFWRQGDSIQLLPTTAGIATTVWVNHIPQKITGLASDASTVTWPEDYELILAYEAGARLMAKGAAESDGTVLLQQLADDLWRDLYADASRFTTDPIMVEPSDNAMDWGGQ